MADELPTETSSRVSKFKEIVRPLVVILVVSAWIGLIFTGRSDAKEFVIMATGVVGTWFGSRMATK